MSIRGLRSQVERLREDMGAASCPGCGRPEGGPGAVTIYAACGPFMPDSPPDRPKCGTCGRWTTFCMIDGKSAPGGPWFPRRQEDGGGWYNEAGRVIDPDGNPLAGTADEWGSLTTEGTGHE